MTGSLKLADRMNDAVASRRKIGTLSARQVRFSSLRPLSSARFGPSSGRNVLCIENSTALPTARTAIRCRGKYKLMAILFGAELKFQILFCFLFFVFFLVLVSGPGEEVAFIPNRSL